MQVIGVMPIEQIRRQNAPRPSNDSIITTMTLAYLINVSQRFAFVLS